MSEFAERYGTREIEAALKSLENRRQYQRQYFKSDKGKLSQRKSMVKSILRRSGFPESEITDIISRIRLADDERGADSPALPGC